MVSSAAISTQGLTKRFGSLTALDGVDLTVPAGVVFGLLGPNGAGKTTAIRILTTILRPSTGRAEVLGHDVVREPAVVRGLIGLAGQYAAVDPNLTGRENLRLIGRLTRLPRRRFRPRADELLERFGLAEAGDRTVRTYSGGMRRRLDVAAALVPHPPVLFLDEPTTGLDPASRLALWEMIRELVGTGTTVLLTTQYLEEADRLASRVAVISAGRLIADDEPARLKERLGNTVIELRMPDENRARQATGMIAQQLSRSPEREGAVLRITARDGSRLLLDILHLLDQHALTPRGVAVHESSLDDVFLALTGHRAEAADQEEPPSSAAGPDGAP
ncbi:daunorubicin resistance protein DrrA family ABC transporter ATP-binding protein [Streptacidiphilus anmyonensis]|uniref:daunorubicin resistance protein DrrA family ABC transporter ATP-binding protein n=1 Tax=Streptacidiphilus anmyonensis TaxID=405782 RepID=UPI0005A94C7C|nr:daunorubicin resistance protein DrrA family ABC transporter ATP-binding protein [Streptacidiphilus anmyonensis]